MFVIVPFQIEIAPGTCVELEFASVIVGAAGTGRYSGASVCGRLGPVVRGQVVVRVLAAVDRVVLDHERVAARGREVDQLGAEGNRVALAVVRVAGPGLAGLPRGAGALLWRGKGAVTTLLDVGAGI